MAEIDYNEVFGVEGEEVQEVAEPVTEPEKGANEQEPAEPAQEITEQEEYKQTEEENRRYAAIRRKAEADERAKAQKEMDDFISSLGFENPYTNKPIKTKAEMMAYQERFAEEQKKEIQEKAGMSDSDYRRFVDSLPEVKAGREAQERVQDLEIRAKIDSQMKEISRISPEIKSMDDLSKLDNFQQLYEMVAKGYQLADAYKVLNYDNLRTKTIEAAKQKALNEIGGKSHLQQSVARGTGSVPVPSDVAAEYRMLVPNATDEEIQAHYNKYIRKE